jgi:ABC-type xylose transport system permease subunit
MMKLEKSATRRTGIPLNTWAMAGVLVAMWATLAILPKTGGTFLTPGNFGNLFAQASVLLIVSVGMTLVILIRGIDLSVGAGVALLGVIASLLHTELGLPVAVAFALTVVVGAAIGAWHGMWTGWLGVPAFVVTLAGFKAYRGGALVLSHATSQTMHDYGFLNDRLGSATTCVVVLVVAAIACALTMHDARRRKALGLPPPTSKALPARLAIYGALAGFVLYVFGGRGIPYCVLIAGAVTLAGVFVTRRTTFGRYLFAIGGNPEAAKLSGIDVKRVTLYVYMLLGALVAVAAIVSGGRTESVDAGNQGYMLELDAVTAVVIGGTSISGGRGSVAGTVLGTLVFSTLGNGMTLYGIDSNWQLVFTGLILLVAVLIDVILKGRRS